MNERTKLCSKCHIEKNISEFRKSGKYYRGACKKCENEMNRNYNKTHKEQIKKQRKEYVEKNKEEIAKKKHKYEMEHREERKKYNEQYRKEHKEYYAKWHKEYSKMNRERLNALDKKWRENNKDKIKKYQQKDYNKRANDPILKLKRNVRNMINTSFRKNNIKKGKLAEEILGCNIDFFINHLLESFKNIYGYEWDRKEKVHIDHIIPLATAKTEDDVIKLCHYTNLQLLKAKDNLQKNNKLDWSYHNSEL